MSCPELLSSIPEHLTVAEFMLDYHHPLRPVQQNIPCLVEDSTGRTITLTELRQRTYGLANVLSHRAIFGPDEVALILSPNHVDYPVIIWAIHRLGGIFTGANHQITVDELSYQIRKSNASLIFVHPNCLDTAISAAHVTDFPPDHIILIESAPNFAVPHLLSLPDVIHEGLYTESAYCERTLAPGGAKTKLAALCFSSGTTGKPKAVAISHYSLIANIVQMAAHNQVSPEDYAKGCRGYRRGDIGLLALPLSHVAGLVINLHFMLFSAMTVVVIPKYDFFGMLDSIVRNRVTHLLLVPPQVVVLCKHLAVKNYDLSLIRNVLCGAAPLPPEVNQQLFDVFPNAQIGQVYGLTEMTTVISMLPAGQFRGVPGSVGKLIPGVVAKVVKADGSLAEPGEFGELIVKGPSQALGYYNDEMATRETFCDGWVRTGDQVMISHIGDVYVADRLKEMLKVRGYPVAPAELEGCILDHPDVTDCCVVGMPDEYSGELPIAYVVLSVSALKRTVEDPREARQIMESIKKIVVDRKAPYKWLKRVEFIEAIPKNPSGKLLRRVLRDHARTVYEGRTQAKL